MTSWKIPLVKIEPNGLTVTNSYFSDSDTKSNKPNSNNNKNDLTALMDSIIESHPPLHYDISQNPQINNNLSVFDQNNKIYSTFSNQSKSRLKRAFYLLIAISKQKTFYDTKKDRIIKYLLTFTTLTLSAKQGLHSDYAIKKQCLDNYLQNLRHSGGLTHYIWRAEPQKNGNLHFHITANQAWDWQYIRDTWNNAQNRLGYINLFNEKHHHINPNSTDIHSVRKIEKAGAYIAKYISKISTDSRSVNGKIWDCSQSLKPKEKCQIYCTDQNHDLLCQLENRFQDRIYSSDYFKFIPLNKDEISNYLPTKWNEQYNNYLSLIQNKYEKTT